MNKLALTAATLMLTAGLASAQTKEQDHQAHHPEGAASAAAKPAPKGAVPKPAAPRTAAPSAPAMPAKDAGMGARMKAMQDMHQKMMDARTPEERQALMAEHMKAMQEGMAMMKQMSEKAAMPGLSGKDGKDGKGGPGMMACMRAMEQRMDMMQMMMEMMMDRMPAGPAAMGQ